jgi:hypothetical protein
MDADDRQRLIEDTEVLFHYYLDKEWPLWREHKDRFAYRALRKAFFAGAGVRDNELVPA